MGRQAGHRRLNRVRETPSTRYGETAPSRSGPAESRSPGILIDSDILIEILRGREPVLSQSRDLHHRGVRAYATAVAWAELGAGLRPTEEEVTTGLLESLGEVVLDAAIGKRAGDYLRLFARSHGIGVADALTAAAASVSGLHLWTRNRRDFPMPDVYFYSPSAR